MKTLKLFGLLIVAALSIAACGGGTPPDANITIELNEYNFVPSDIELRVGQNVTFVLENTGQLDHELMIGRNVTEDSQGRPSGYAQDFFIIAGVSPDLVGGGMIMDHSDGHGDESEESMEGMEGMDHGEGEDDADHDDSSEEIDMGGVTMIFQPVGSDSSTLTFTVTEDMLGEWEMGCFQLDGVHYTSGMVGTLTVSN